MSRILIVDDDPQGLYMLESLLRGHGHKVVTAVNGTEALMKARRDPPDLIVSDFFMPTMDGFALCRECKKDDRLRSIPFIAYTATYTDPKDERLAMSLGAARFLVKPAEPRVLLNVVEQVLADQMAGRLAPPPAMLREDQHLREYTEAIIRKLEEKVAQLSRANHALQQEMSQRQAAEELLRESEAQLRAMVDMASVGIAQADPHTGQWLSVNAKLCEITGRSPDEMLGTYLTEITPAEDREADWEAYKRVVRGEAPQYRAEKRCIRKDGSSAWVNVNMKVLRDAAGQPVRTMATIEDITDHKRAEEAIRQSEERFRTLVESVTDYIYTVKVRDGRAVETSHSPGCLGVTGYEPEEFRADAGLWLRMVHRDDRLAVQDQTAKLLAGQMAWALEHRIVHKNDEIRWVRNTPVLRYDPHGRFVGYEGLVQDITEQRKLQEQLFQAQKMEAVGQLAGGVAHDFRNQLTVISGYGEMLIRRQMVTGEAKGYVEQILKASERSAMIAEQLLAFSRRQVLRPEVVNLNSVIGDLSKSVARLLGEDIRLSFSPNPELDRVKVDPGQFQQALMNLVLNARDAMPKGGQLTIETDNAVLDDRFVRLHAGASAGPHVMVTVSDTGCGMDSQTLSRIFEPFFTTKAAGEGTGLGLAMVYGFIKQSGGYVSVQSEPGKGARFRLYLPRTEESPGAGTAASPNAELPKGTGTILLVEDEEAIRRVVSQTLRECGYTVLEAANAQDAIKLGDRHKGPIHLLIADVVMPGLSGPDLAEHFRESRPGMRVLLVSGYAGKMLTSRGVALSGADLLTKPVSSWNLAQTVRRILRRG
ncbi:MAG: response regulator [Phycisphaerae bacterium]